MQLRLSLTSHWFECSSKTPSQQRYNPYILVGQTVSHYRVLEKIGEGGMGVVYKAEDTKLERLVALKFLSGHLLGDQDVRKRFEREAKAAAALDHANVCTVYEIDQANGQTFIAMALIEGESLAKKIAQGPLKLEEALDIARQVAEGLRAAHDRGGVHRDIKPENVIVDQVGHVTILDFGLAQLAQASRLTRADQARPICRRNRLRALGRTSEPTSGRSALCCTRW